MEVLLLQDIPGIGKKNDLIVVGDGFALNCLLPRRAALVATPLVRKRYAEFIKRRAEEKEREKAVAAGAAKVMEGKTVRFARKTTKTGKLYAALTEKAIAEALKDQHDVDILAEHIRIDEPIKAIGSFEVHAKTGDQTFPVTIVVEQEKSA